MSCDVDIRPENEAVGLFCSCVARRSRGTREITRDLGQLDKLRSIRWGRSAAVAYLLFRMQMWWRGSDRKAAETSKHMMMMMMMIMRRKLIRRRGDG